MRFYVDHFGADIRSALSRLPGAAMHWPERLPPTCYEAAVSDNQ